MFLDVCARDTFICKVTTVITTHSTNAKTLLENKFKQFKPRKYWSKTNLSIYIPGEYLF